MLEFLAFIIYLIVGLLISSTWFRRRQRLGTAKRYDDPPQAALIVIGWPLFLVGWPVARTIEWLYFR